MEAHMLLGEKGLSPTDIGRLEMALTATGAGVAETPVFPPPAALRRVDPVKDTRAVRSRAGSRQLIFCILALIDLVVPSLAILIAGALVGHGGSLVAALAMSLVALPALGAIGAYRLAPASPGGRARLLGPFVLAAGVCAWAAWAANGIFAPGAPELASILAAPLLPIGWLAGRLAIDATVLRHAERVVMIGAGPVSRRAVDALERQSRGRSEIVACLDDPLVVQLAGAGPNTAPIDELPSILASEQVDRVIVAFPSCNDAQLAEMLRSCEDAHVAVDVVPRLFELMTPDAGCYRLAALPVVGLSRGRRRRWSHAIKRALDVLGASLLLALAAPLLGLIALAVALDSGWPVIYRQERIGLGRRRFRVLKFRTMTPDADRHGSAHIYDLRDGRKTIEEAVAEIKGNSTARVTRVGALLRRTSLDELPQLWNVVRGEMSLVGPRPIRDFEVDALDERWARERHSVRPGLTGHWQLSGRSDLSWTERMQLDYSYVRHWSVASDVMILGRTVRAVLVGDGAR
jgi:exopolysaccharide biosynthesis polyprenyl glycosylphosphotransferase